MNINQDADNIASWNYKLITSDNIHNKIKLCEAIRTAADRISEEIDEHLGSLYKQFYDEEMENNNAKTID